MQHFFIYTTCLTKCVRLIILLRYSSNNKAFKYSKPILSFAFQQKLVKVLDAFFFAVKMNEEFYF